MYVNEGNSVTEYSAGHLPGADHCYFLSIHYPFPITPACLDHISGFFVETLRAREKSVSQELCWVEENPRGSQNVILTHLSSQVQQEQDAKEYVPRHA